MVKKTTAKKTSSKKSIKKSTRKTYGKKTTAPKIPKRIKEIKKRETLAEKRKRLKEDFGILPNEDKRDTYEVEYPFLDNFVMKAIVNKKENKQYLEVWKANQRGKYDDHLVINSIHTVINKIPIDKFEDIVNDPEFNPSSLIASSEGNEKIELDDENRFFAFKSWAKGITEGGLQFLSIQEEIEKYSQFASPIAMPILRFISKYDLKYLTKFIIKLEKEAIFEGKIHFPTFISNFDFLLNAIDTVDSDLSKFLIKYFVEFNLPIDIILQRIKRDEYYEDEYDQQRLFLIESPLMIDHLSFKNLFSIKNREIMAHLLRNPRITEIPEFEILLNRPNSDLLFIIEKIENRLNEEFVELIINNDTL